MHPKAAVNSAVSEHSNTWSLTKAFYFSILTSCEKKSQRRVALQATLRFQVYILFDVKLRSYAYDDAMLLNDNRTQYENTNYM